MTPSDEFLIIILEDWIQRVLADIERKKIAPVPWNIREAMRGVFVILRQLRPPEASEGEEGGWE